MITVRGTVARVSVAAASAVAVLAPVLPAAAATPRPPVRTVDRSAFTLGCAFQRVDEINGRLDSISVPDGATVMVAGRPPAGGAFAMAVTPYGSDRATWSVAQRGTVLLDTATDRTTAVAGTASVGTYTFSGWVRSPLPAPGPVRSLGALPGHAAVVLLPDGKLYRHTTSWTRLPGLPGTTLAVSGAGGVPTALSVEKVASGQRVRAWQLVNGGWVLRRTTTVAGLPAMTTSSVRWAPGTTGGVLAVNGSGRLAGVVDMRSSRSLPTSVLATTTPVTSAEALPDGRVVLGHAAPAAAGRPATGSLSLLADGMTSAVPGTSGDPVVGLATAPGQARVLATMRSADLGGGDVETSLAICR